MRSFVTIGLAFLLAFLALGAGAENDPGTLLYEEIRAEEHIMLEEALARLDDVSTNDRKTESFIQKLRDLNTCQGVYYQKDEDGLLEQEFYADVTIYLAKGEPWAHIEYTGFSGELGDAPIDYDLSGEYLFQTGPEGTYWDTVYDFSIGMTEERMHVLWGGDIEYDLVRGDEKTVALSARSFTDEESYRLIVEKARDVFEGYDCNFSYDEENHHLHIYVGIQRNFSLKLVNNADTVRDAWEEYVESVRGASSEFARMVQIATKDSFYPSEGHCTIMIVNDLKLSNQYSSGELCLSVEDGHVVFDILGPEQDL